jgi:hypothetical protein
LLVAVGYGCQVVADTIDDPGYHGFVVFTDYQDPVLAG